MSNLFINRVSRCDVLVKKESDKESVKGNIEFSINRLLNGQMVLSWLVEKIRTSGISKEDLRNVLDMIRENYADNVIFIALEKACRENGFV